jgi:tetratricopeptide (TPR) repeat protein
MVPEHFSLAVSRRLRSREAWVIHHPPELHGTLWHTTAEMFETNPTENENQELAIFFCERAVSLTTDIE